MAMIEQSGMIFSPVLKWKILFVTSQDKKAALDVDEEARMLRKVSDEILGMVHNKNGAYATVEFVYIQAARFEDIVTAIEVEKPDWVHFAGHGWSKSYLLLQAQKKIQGLEAALQSAEQLTEGKEAAVKKARAELEAAQEELPYITGGLVLKNAAGKATIVSLEDLAVAFSGTTIRGCFFNACWSIEGAEVLLDVLEVAVGTSEPINDDAAIHFATCFYRSLLLGFFLEKAFKLAVIAAAIEKANQRRVPALRIKPGLDPKTWRLFDPSVPPPVPPQLAAALGGEGPARSYEKKPVVAEGDALDRAWPPSSDGDPDDDTRAG